MDGVIFICSYLDNKRFEALFLHSKQGLSH